MHGDRLDGDTSPRILWTAVLILAAVLACSRTSEPLATTDAEDSPARPLVAMADGAGREDGSPEGRAPTAPPDARDSPRSEEGGGCYRMAGAHLEVEVCATGDLDTAPAADRVVLQNGRSRIIWRSDAEHGGLAPLIDHVVDLGSGQALLLGRSTPGDDVSSLHAVLVNNDLSVVDWLRVTLPRAQAEIILEGTTNLSLWIPAQIAGPGVGVATSGASIPSEVLPSLAIREPWSTDAVLPYEAAPGARPVFELRVREGRQVLEEDRWVRFSITADGFRLEAPCSDAREVVARTWRNRVIDGSPRLDVAAQEVEAVDINGDGRNDVGVVSIAAGSGGDDLLCFSTGSSCTRWVGSLWGTFETVDPGEVVLWTQAGSCDVLQRRMVLQRGLLRTAAIRHCECVDVSDPFAAGCTAWRSSWLGRPDDGFPDWGLSEVPHDVAERSVRADE
jgi:hypothetical protein